MTTPEDDGNYFDEGGEELDARRGVLTVIDGGLTPDPLDVELCAVASNDLGNAKRLIARNADRLYATKEKGFGVFDGRRFEFEYGDAAAGRLAHAVAERMLSHETSAFYQTQKGRGEAQEAFDKRAASFYGFAVQAGNNGRTTAMMEQAERMLTLPLAEFDADPDRLAVQNGTLILPRGFGQAVRFVPSHDPADRITKIAGAAYDPKAKAPEWEKFLARVQPEADMRAFLARVMGYCLTGHIQEQAYFIFQGKGGDGKSTFMTAVKAALGEYAADADIESFLHRERKGSEASPDMARLAGGVRLVKASEPEQGARFAEAMLKKVTGGEPVTARHLHRELFEFTPQWKLVISCNRKPQIRGDDRGIWRRTLVAPWPVSIAKEEMDTELEPKLKAEASGILNWLIAGWRDWRDGDEGPGGVYLKGLRPPKVVLDAVADYRLNSNPFGAWFDDCCVADKTKRESTTRLLKSYRGWANAEGFEAMNETSFGRALSDRNLGRQKSSGTIWRTGVVLNEAGEDAVRAYEEAHLDAATDAKYGGVK